MTKPSQGREMNADIQTTYPLVPMQQGMLFHYLRGEQPGVDIEQIVCRLDEELELPLFTRAWQRVVDRYDVLRISFVWQGLSEPVQRVHSLVAVEVEERDWRDVVAAKEQEHLEQFLFEDRLRGFDLSRVPLMRFSLCSLGAARHFLIWTFHHSLIDGRSFAILLKEVFERYHHFLEGKDLELPPPRAYRDFIDWLQSLDYSAAERYWRNVLKGSSLAISAPIETSVTGEVSPEKHHGIQHAELSKEVSSALKVLALEIHVTPNTLVQGAWALTLSRFGGGEDVLFGATRACRHWTDQGVDSLVGLFINTLPVRVRINFTQSVLCWLGELREQNIAVRPYEHSPLVKVQSWSDVRAGRPLFESILVFDKSDLDTVLRSPGGAWLNRHFDVYEQTNYPLTLYGFAEPQLHFKLAYDRRRFDDSLAAGMLTHTCVALEGMVAGPQGSVSAVPALGKAERDRVVHEWNSTSRSYRAHRCVHHLIEDQVKRVFRSVSAFLWGFLVHDPLKPVLDLCQGSL